MKSRLHVFRTVGLASLVILAGCAKQSPPPAVPSKPVTVAVAPITYSDKAVPIRVPGVLARRSEPELAFKVGGLIEEVRVRAGDVVKQGEILAKLRSDEIDAQVLQARRLLEKAQRELERVQRLQQGSVATKENAEDAATAVDVAAANLRIAEFNQQHSVIVAPTDGRILKRMAEPQEFVGPARPILIFGSDSEGWVVRAGLSERDASRLKLQDSAEIKDLETGDVAMAGHVANISDAADPATRTTEVEVALDDPIRGTRSGYVVSLVLHPSPVRARPVIAASALVEATDGRATVFVTDAQQKKVKKHRVEIAESDREVVYLKTELPRDAFVVTAGAEYLNEGADIEVAREGK
jgi:membrane fusion protein, multidrug efflux system